MGCLIISEPKSSIFISNSVFFNISSLEEGLLYMLNSDITIENSKFEELFSEKLEGNCLKAYSSNISIRRSFFTNFDCNCLFLTSSKLAISQIEFLANFMISATNSAANFGAIYCEDCLAFEILDSSFENIQDIPKGAAIQLFANEIFAQEITSLSA